MRQKLSASHARLTPVERGRDRSPLVRRGWGVVGIVASVVALVACAWLAANARVSPSYDLPVVGSLKPTPDNNVLPGVLVAAVALALFAFWFRRRGRRVRPQVGIAVATAITIGLGAASYLPCRTTESWVSLAVWVANLFALQVETLVIGPGAPADSVCYGPYPLTFQVARLFGFAALVFTAFAIVFSLVQPHLDHLFLSLRGKADIVTGLTVESLPLVRALALDRVWDRRPALVVVLPDGEDPLAHQARALGARVWVGDDLSGDALRRLLLTPFGRVAVRRLFAVSDTQSENLRVVTQARDLIADDKQPDGSWLARRHVPRLVARFSDAREARDWRLSNVNAPGCFLDALAPDELVSRQIVDRLVETGRKQLIIAGDTPLTVALLDEIALQRCLRDELMATIEKDEARDPGSHPTTGTRGAGPGRISLEQILLVGPTATDVGQEWESFRAPGANRPTPLAVSVVGGSWEDAVNGLPGTADAAIVITDHPSPAISSRAMRLARRHRDLLVIRPSQNLHGVSSLADAHVSDTVPGPVIRYQRSLVPDGSTPADSWTVLARQQHESYRAARGAYRTPHPSPARLPWGTGPIEDDQLPNFYRDDNLRQQRLVLLFLAARGYHWLTLSATDRVDEVAEPDLIALARAEHQRWCDFRLRQKWRYPSATEQARYVEAASRDRHRRNLNLVDWFSGASLPRPGKAPVLSNAAIEELRAWNRGTLEILIDRLRQWGIAPSGGPAWHRYRRTGTVKAEVLAERRVWRSATGDRLESEAADYWVWTADKRLGRGVDAVTFVATHRAVPGQPGHFERVGSYWARRLEGEFSTVSREGVEHGQSGMWLVQDAAGSEWFVPAEEFPEGYVLAED